MSFITNAGPYIVVEEDGEIKAVLNPTTEDD